MNSDLIRKIISDEKFENSYLSLKDLKYDLKSDFQAICDSARFFDDALASDKWLLENLDFLKEMVKSTSNKKAFVRAGIQRVVVKAMREEEFSGKTEEFRNLFDLINQASEFSEKELICLRDLVVACLIKLIRISCDDHRTDLPRLITMAHHISKVDFFQICHSLSPIEKLLRQDPVGIYPNMTRTTQLLYRKKIEREAKRQGKTAEALCKVKLEKAREKQQHIGFFLERREKCNLYYPVILLLFFTVSLCFFTLIGNFILWFFASVPLYFFSKSFADFIFARCVRREPLPSMRCETVGESEKTCVVITSLISEKKDIDSLCRKLNQYRLNNRSEKDEIYFGLLCDLPQSKRESCPQDKDLVFDLEKAIENLNQKSDCYFAILRKRSYHRSEDAYVGWERKRGAIEQFVSILKGNLIPKTHLFFGNRNVIGSRYFITLDADSELGIGQAKRLIGKMNHPLNRPIVGERSGVKTVIRGHGIIQPQILSSLSSRITTPYAKIFSNGSGEVPYAFASYDTMQSLFGEGIFCGKGIIDVESFYQVMRGVLPEQSVLSHDMPEGALLRCAIAGDEYFVDSDPQTAVSHYKRQHRWIRGDVQNLPFLKLLPLIRRVFALENVLRYILPLSEFILIVISGFYGQREAILCAAMVLLIRFQSFFETAVSSLLTGNLQLIGRRFKTKMRNLILNSFYQSVISLSAIAHETVYFLDAILRSTYRMFISRKKLLEWQVYSPFSKAKEPIVFFLPSIVLTITALFFVKTAISFTILILCLFFPILMVLLSRPYVETDRMTKKEKDTLLKMAQKEFLFFQNMVGEKSSFLPPDNIQFEPVEKIANRTSPTNIGLYLVSLVAANDLKIINANEMCRLIKKAMDAVARLEHFQGHLYNWYDLETLGVIGERFISTVDSGNFIASLVIVSEALKEIKGQDPLAADLIIRLQKEIEGANFNVLYDRSKNLFFVGVFPDDKSRETSHYDLYMSEARITSFLGIALEKIPPIHWNCMERPLLSFGGRVGVGSWTGTCFEYFMPTLFLPIVENSMEDESLDFAFFCQKKYCARFIGGEIFGISESGYQKTDEAGNLQYMAFGVPYLSVLQKENYPKVFSPYSSFLMLARGGRSILENLKNLDDLGANGPFGYFEAVEFDSNFIDDFSVVSSYMAHHKGMSVIALCNALLENIMVKRFMKNEQFSAKRELLAERFPIEGKVYKRKGGRKAIVQREVSAPRETYDFSRKKSKGKLLTDGKFSLVAYDNGENRFLYDKSDLFDPKKGGITVRIITESRMYLFCCEESDDCRVRFCEDCVEYILVSGKASIVMRFELVSGKSASLIRLEVNGISEKCRIEVVFDFMLQKEKEYRSHPAFQNLSLEGESTSRRLTLRRRGIESHRYLIIESRYDFKTSFYSRPEETSFPYKMLLDPKVTITFEFDSAESVIVPLIFSCEKKNENLIEAYLDGSCNLKKEIAESGVRRMKRLDMICSMDRETFELENELLLFFSSCRKFLRSDINKSIGKEFLWQFGVSGDVPIISVFIPDLNKAFVKKVSHYLRAYKKMQIAGIECFDLVILHVSKGGYFDPIRDELSSLITQYKCEFLVGKHPGIHFVACDSDETVEVFRRVSYCFVDANEYEINDSFPEVGITSIKATFENKKEEAKSVGKFLKQGFSVDKALFNPPVPFSHIVSDRSIGFVCNQNSLGFTWFRNSGLNRISKWENLPQSENGEKIYLQQSGEFFDLLHMAQIVEYHDRVAIYKGEIKGCSYSVISTISAHLSAKDIFVLLSDPLQKDSELIFSFIPALGKDSDRNILISDEEPVILLKAALSEEYDSGSYFYGNGKKIFVSSDGERLNASVKSEMENTFLLGSFSSANHLDFLLRVLTDLNAEDLLRLETEKRALEKTESLAPMEFWTRYQAIHSRFFGRTGLYQSSGAYGFRDQLQDSLIFLDEKPEVTRLHIIRSAAHQFMEGDVLHWWHSIRRGERWDPGVRSRCSDDYLWLLFVTSEYIKKTGDDGILSVKIPFLSDVSLTADEAERYLNPKMEGFGSLLEHLEKATLLFLDRGLGEHGLPHMGSGDWNDGMNLVDGESAWLGFFGAICLRRCREYFDPFLQEKIDLFLKKLSAGLKSAFNGVWFVRAFCRDGKILGNDISLESECSFDLITQAFAAFYQNEFSGTEFSLKNESVKSALTAAYQILSDEKTRVTRLFVKPFSESVPSPGYIQRYCAGVRENGGQYTHAAVWFALALLEFGQKSSDSKLIFYGKEVAKRLDPSNHLSAAGFSQYQREPYVLCGDVYDAPGFRGHGGWSWYTGAAGWYVRLLKEIKKLENKEKLP